MFVIGRKHFFRQMTLHLLVTSDSGPVVMPSLTVDDGL